MYTALKAHIFNWPAARVDHPWSHQKNINEYKDGLLVFSPAEDRVIWCGRAPQLPQTVKAAINKTLDYSGSYLFPGLVDIHVHLVQSGIMARDGYPLLPWLQKFVFPAEKTFTPEKSAQVAAFFYDRLHAAGTTSSVVYGPAWLESLLACLETARQKKARTWLGQTLMDQGSYRNGGKMTTRLIAELEKGLAAAADRQQYAVTPRFALSCRRELLEACSDLARRNQAVIQTHLSENHDEIKATLKAFPECDSYAAVYDRYGCLTERTLLGHCIHLTAAEERLISKRQSAVAYCPSSNLFLQSGILDLEKLKLRVGMGSDAAGGPDLSMIETAKMSLYSRKAALIQYNSWPAVKNGRPTRPHHSLNPLVHLFLATRGGGQALGEPLGHLNAGARPDFFTVKKEDLDPYLGHLPSKMTRVESRTGPADLIARLLYQGGRPLVETTYSGGRLVYRRPFKRMPLS